jgi:hypothetical protein
MNTRLWKNLPAMLVPPRAEPFPGLIGTFMARDALTLSASYLGLTPQDVVWLPAYLCKEVLRPFIHASRVAYYDVGPDLTIDPAYIDSLLRATPARLLVMINYFGFLQPFRRELAAVCREHGTTLLEDCAHSLLTPGSGDTGDLAVYSFRKTLPVADGGALRVKNPSRPVQAVFHPRLYSNALSVLALVKALSSVSTSAFSRAGVADLRADAMPATKPANGHLRILPLSWFASNGIGHAPFADILTERRRDYAFWADLARESGAFRLVFPELPADVCPLGCPVVASDRTALRALFERLGVPAKIHWLLPPGVGETCDVSQRLSREMLTLPVFPDLTERTRARLGPALRPWPSR